MSEKPKILTAKQQDTIEYYISPESETRDNWCQSYLKAGYSRCKGWRTNAIRVKTKDYIVTAINKAKGELKQQITISREYLFEKLQDILDNSTNERNVIAAASLIGDFKGFKRELAPNVEKEAERVAKMSKEDREIARLLAQKRSNELAEGQHHKLNTG